MGNPLNRGGRVTNLSNTWEDRSRQQQSGRISSNRQRKARRVIEDEAPAAPPEEDNDVLIQGLTPGQLRVLAIKVYELLLEELRLEAERTGSSSLR